MNNARDEYLRKKNLTSAQSETLLFYFRNQGQNITDLKDHLQVTHQAARKLVEKLRAKEYLYILPSPKDARVAEIFLTEQGVEICTKLIKDGTRTAAGLLKGFSSEEKKKLESFLMRIEDNLAN